jgi:ribosomal-protein-serine acetyltransferase
MARFKNELIGRKIVLKRFKPTILTAQTIFKTVADNRQHLGPWFVWLKGQTKAEDSFKFLLENEKKLKLGEKFDYGIYLNNEYIGSIGVFSIDKINKSAEIGYWLSKKFVRNGYMTEAVKLVEKEAFLNLGLNRLQICCDEKNLPSAGVAKKCGYIFEGKRRESAYSNYFKNFRNILVFSKLKSEFNKKKK